MTNGVPVQHSRQTAPTQVWEENVRRTPMSHQRFIRPRPISVVTTSFGGKLVPLKCVGLLREDGCLNSQVTVNVQMAETAKMLLNPVRISVMAYFIPKLAFDRFQDMGTIDRSYNGQQELDGSVVEWFRTSTHGNIANTEFYSTLGLHQGTGQDVNTDYLEAYNILWNYLAEQRSPSLSAVQRAWNDNTLAPAFWEHTQMKHVKPTFDDALIAGEVPLSFVEGSDQLPLRSLGAGRTTPNDHVAPTNGSDTNPPSDGSTFDWTGQIWAELQQNSAVVSLANIDLARETAAWARFRTQYQGISEDWMIDQLMQGIRIRDENLRHPIYVDHAQTIVGMSQRYATDAANLTDSVADGRTAVPITLRVPQTTCGGVLMILGQALPEQLYERQRDYYFAATAVDDLPNRQADELDPQPVVMVTNGEVDESHNAPNDLFGYAPLNHQWMTSEPNIGGRYYRPDPAAAWTEDRNRIWTPEVIDPQLGPDFYLSTDLSHNIFKTSTEHPFEWWVNGQANIEGLTYFGPALRESLDDYQKVIDSVDTERLVGDGTDTPT